MNHFHPSIEQFHQLREVVFTNKHVDEIEKICLISKFNYSILSFSIEMCEKIFDVLVDKYVENRSSLQLNANSETIYLHLSRKIFLSFFKNLKYRLLMVDFPNSDQCIQIFAFISISLTIKLHGNNSNYAMRRALNKAFNNSEIFHFCKLPKEKFFSLIENEVMKLLKFNLHIDSLDCFIDALLLKFKNKLFNINVTNLKDGLFCYLAKLYRSRCDLSRMLVSNVNARDPSRSTMIYHLLVENMASNKNLLSGIIICAIFPIYLLSYDSLLQLKKEIDLFSNFDLTMSGVNYLCPASIPWLSHKKPQPAPATLRKSSLMLSNSKWAHDVTSYQIFE